MSPSMSQGMDMAQSQRMVQGMVLTPQMREQLEILVSTQLKVDQRIRVELQRNPYLESTEFNDQLNDNPSLDHDLLRSDEAPPFDEDHRDTELAADFAPTHPDRDGGYDDDYDGYDTPPPRATPASSGTDTDSGADSGATPDSRETPDDGFSHIDDVDTDWDEIHEDRTSRSATSRAGDDDDAFDPVEHLTARPPSFAEMLAEQLRWLSLPNAKLRYWAERILDHLNENGWLVGSLREVVPPASEAEYPPPDDDELEAALRIVQSLDPPGVGARDDRECLMLQLERTPEQDPDGIARRLVDKHLEDLAANRLPKIARALEVSLDDVKQAIALIRRLEPAPGRAYTTPDAQVIRPDARVYVEDDGESLGVTLPTGTIAETVEIPDFYIALFERSRRARILRERILADPSRAPDFRSARDELKAGGEKAKFCRQSYESATGLLKAVSMRNQTLLKTIRETIRRQSAYLLGHAATPAPLMMQEVANAIGYDDSTVSRTVKDKYLDTPRGILAFRDLFSRAALATGGTAFGHHRPRGRAGRPASAPAPAVSGSDLPPPPEAATPALVMGRLRELLETEDRRRPLKDNELQDRMAALGMPLARRTVAHYRQLMDFPSHSRRREY